MYFWLFLISSAVALAAAGLWVLRGTVGRRWWRRQYEKATAALRKDARRLEREFLESAAATGKPRGLVWKESRFHESALLARDRATGDIYALVEITIAFEAVVGGAMEDVAAVSNLRCATALLEWRDHRWTTAGRVLFNLQPQEAVERYSSNLETIRPISF